MGLKLRFYVAALAVLSSSLSPFYASAQDSEQRSVSSFFGFGDDDEEPEDTSRAESEDSAAPVPESLTETSEVPGLPANLNLSGANLLALLLPESVLKSARPWQPPDFSNQKALGYAPETFAIPAGMEKRVAFWVDIYSKYTTNQGVLHDTQNLDIVYRAIDFNAIMADPNKTPAQKRKERERLVKEARADVEARLHRLAGVTSAEGLTGEDLRYWKMFEGVNEANRFGAAAAKGRVRFQLGQKDRFVLGIYYSGRYIKQMEKIFREANLPIELTRLPFVESSFNIYARSRVGASGVWQFMRRTARPYMKVNRDVDERNDPLRATRASARLLTMNYDMLKHWPLAVTAYNHGAYGVQKITERLGTKNLPDIIKRATSTRFGFASENFYACFLAALTVERNAKNYFGDVKWSPELDNVEIKLSKSISYQTLVKWFDGDEDLANLYNPHLSAHVRRGKVGIPSGLYVRVTSHKERVALDDLFGSMRSSESFKVQEYPKVASPLAGQPVLINPVLPGVSASSGSKLPGPVNVPVVMAETKPAVETKAAEVIAPAASETGSEVKPAVAVDSKPLGDSTVSAETVVGDIAKNEVQNPETAKPQGVTVAEVKAASAANDVTAAVKTHKVRRGDTLSEIARKFGVTVRDLRAANQLKRSGRILPGQVLIIPGQ